MSDQEKAKRSQFLKESLAKAETENPTLKNLQLLERNRLASDPILGYIVSFHVNE